MYTNRNWNILSWNVRGINSQAKRDDLRDKITESACSIVCIQETKREQFDLVYIRKFCNRSFNKFVYSQSHGASGGLITIWKGHLFDGIALDITDYSITVQFLPVRTTVSCNKYLSPAALLLNLLLSLGF